MRIGTKSLLFGGHQLILHPIYVVRAWRRLYCCWPSWRELVCIVVHDWGYFGKADMDGPEGQDHPLAGAHIAERLLGWGWGEFTLYHSGTMVRLANACLDGMETCYDVVPSDLCWADKLGNCLMPKWMHLTLVRLSGEIDHYKSYLCRPLCGKEWADDDEFYRCAMDHMRRRVAEGVRLPVGSEVLR